MIFLSRAIVPALIALILVVSTPAQAQERFLPFQMPPWIAQQHDARDTHPAENGNIRPSRQQDRSIPAPPMPDDYRGMMAPMQQIMQPGPKPSTLSPLEKMYSARILDSVHQFGYDMFATPEEKDPFALYDARDTAVRRSALPAGAVQDRFILNIGDRLNITFRGQRQTSGIYGVSSDGLLIIEDLAPIPAAGRSIAQVRDALKAVAADLHSTDVHVALESVQQVNVLVVGHVQRPGQKNLTVFHTVLDALMESGGVQKTGSLRQIKMIRGGRVQMVDLYALLVHGGGAGGMMDLSLRDGDRIVVPPVGPTIAVAGGVKRPGIYEILPALRGMRHRPDQASQRLSLQEVLDLSGGILSPGDNRFVKLSMQPDGREVTEEIDDPFIPVFGDGAILSVARATERRTGTVQLAGHTRRAGIHALRKDMALSDLLRDRSVFGPDIYPLIGVIERDDAQTLTRRMIAFPPNLVVSGDYDHSMQDGDTVILFSQAQIKSIQNQSRDDGQPAPSGSFDPEREDEVMLTPALRAFLNERAAFVRGAVRHAGAWPVSDGATLEHVLAVAGGLTIEANADNIEITTRPSGQQRQDTQRIAVNLRETSGNAIAIAPGDAVRVNQAFRKTEGQSVVVLGEVAHPGHYDLLPGDTLGRLLARAGGLSDHAYPDGAIFSRDAERKAEEARFRAAARDLERAVAAAADNADRKKQSAPDAEQLSMARELANELRTVEGVGRITVEANPAILATRPELDILLQPGDRVYIPRRPLTVRVHGEVLSPASLQFRADKSPRDYIAEAGGMTYHADDSRTFVLLPDGSAQPLAVSAWNHRATMIPPGSTIVVPRDPKPFDFMTSARDFTQILSNLAITGIFIKDLRDD